MSICFILRFLLIDKTFINLMFVALLLHNIKASYLSIVTQNNVVQQDAKELLNILLLLKQYTNNLNKNRIVSEGFLHFIGMNLHAGPCRLECMTYSVLK